jgi:hypothetical protein
LLKAIDLTNGLEKQNPTSFSGWRGFEGSGGSGFGLGSVQPRSALKFTLDIFVVRLIDAYVENKERLPDATSIK